VYLVYETPKYTFVMAFQYVSKPVHFGCFVIISCHHMYRFNKFGLLYQEIVKLRGFAIICGGVAFIIEGFIAEPVQHVIYLNSLADT